MDRHLPKNVTKAYPEARSRYNEFTRGIREETSSSSYKSDHHISPPRKTQKSSFQSRSPPHSNADKGVGLKKRKTKGMKKGKKRKIINSNKKYINYLFEFTT